MFKGDHALSYRKLHPVEIPDTPFRHGHYGLIWSSSVKVQCKITLIHFKVSFETIPPEKLVMFKYTIPIPSF